MLEYQDYKATIEFDEVDKIFTGTVKGIKTQIAFHGENATELENNFKASIDHYLEVCQKLNTTPEKQFSGKFMVRMTPGQHAMVSLKSKELNKSLNAFAIDSMIGSIDNQTTGVR